MKYRKKPIVIEAFRYGLDVPTEWSFEGHVIETVCSKDEEYLLIHTLEGVMRANIGDYLHNFAFLMQEKIRSLRDDFQYIQENYVKDDIMAGVL